MSPTKATVGITAGSTQGPTCHLKPIALCLLLGVNLSVSTILLTASPVEGQRHLPDLQVFGSRTAMALDGSVETPAVNNGLTVSPSSGIGQLVAFQVFVPRAAYENGFSVRVQVERADGQPAGFEIAEAKDWDDRPLQSFAGGGGLTSAHVRPRFGRVPPTGHVATVVLNPLQSDAFKAPVRVRVWVAIVSTPPRRVQELQGEQFLLWF